MKAQLSARRRQSGSPVPARQFFISYGGLAAEHRSGPFPWRPAPHEFLKSETSQIDADGDLK